MLLWPEKQCFVFQHQACATFNLLNFERRSVAAALIPPKTLKSRHAMPDIFVEPGWDDFFKEPDERINPNTGVSLPNRVCCSNV